MSRAPRRAFWPAVLLAGGLSAAAAPARAATVFETVDLGLKGELSGEANTRSYDWGPTVSVGLLSSDKSSRDRFKYEMEYSYDDSLSKVVGADASQQSRVRTSEFKYAKISVLQLFGWDLEEHLRFVPYASGGVQYVDSRADTDGERQNDFYWAPTWGVGVEFTLTPKTSLAVDFDANTLGDGRRISHLTLELKFSVLGDPDEE